METKRKGGSAFKFAVIFAAFTIATLLLSCASIYFHAMDAYKRQCEENLEKIALCLEEMIAADGENFLQYQEVFLKRGRDMRIRYDFSDWRAEKEKFDRLFAQKYPGKAMGRDVRASELDGETQMAYAVYMHEYWLSAFERTKDSFGIVDAYYAVPTGEPLHMYRILDAVRKKEERDGVPCLGLAEDGREPLEGRQKMWEAWNTGKKPQGHDEYDGAYGRRFACYTPVFVNGRKIGLIGTEIGIEPVNWEILKRAIWQTAVLTLILAVCVAALLFFAFKNSVLSGKLMPAACVAALLWFIHKKYLSKLSQPQEDVCVYEEEKNEVVVETSEQDATGGDGLAALPMQAAAMILELEPYMKSLVDMTRKFGEAWAHVDAMDELTDRDELMDRDALIGVRSKAAYDSEIQRMEWELAQDKGKQFGFVIIALNDLKRINGAFGHEQGNTSIQRLCRIVCAIFERSPVFRIGGNEFAVVLENDDYANADALLAELGAKLDETAEDASLEPWERLSAAVGVARYDAATDSSAANVFKRAHKAVHLREKEMRAVRIE